MFFFALEAWGRFSCFLLHSLVVSLSSKKTCLCRILNWVVNGEKIRVGVTLDYIYIEVYSNRETFYQQNGGQPHYYLGERSRKNDLCLP